MQVAGALRALLSKKIWAQILYENFCQAVLVLLIFISQIFGAEIQHTDYEILEQFFKMGISDEGYGYVLDGVKPISIRDFYPLDVFPITKDLKYAEQEFNKTILAREAAEVWKRACKGQKNFVLKAIPLQPLDLPISGWEVQLINLRKLREVIDANVNLFRYVLGPGLEVEQLVNQIAYSENRLMDVLRNDLVLTGIVLGFGSYNSLVGGRIETIHSLSISRDIAPLALKSCLMQNNEILERYGSYYLEFAGGDDASFRGDFSFLKPSLGFSTIQEELITLKEKSEPLPIKLKETPGFIFSAFKGGGSNLYFFNQLSQIQKKTQVLLKKPHVLEEVLEKIGIEKPTAIPGGSKKKVVQWEYLLSKVASRFDEKEEQTAFKEAFEHPSPSSRKAPPLVGVSKHTLRGLKKALLNLQCAREAFDRFSHDCSLQTKVPKQLYFKTDVVGYGKELNGQDRIRVGYVVKTIGGEVLFANHDDWLALSQTIPGFAHGVQGMKVGEKRSIFIHPILGYAALTTLPPCTGLVITVTLLDIDEASLANLPPLTPLDLSWVEDPSFYSKIEKSVRQKPRFTGSFYRDLLDRMDEKAG